MYQNFLKEGFPMENSVKPVYAGNQNAVSNNVSVTVTNDGRMIVKCALSGTSQCPNPDCTGYHYCPCSRNHSDN